MLSSFYCLANLPTLGGPPKTLVLYAVKVVFVDEIEVTPEQALFFFVPSRAGH